MNKPHTISRIILTAIFGLLPAGGAIAAPVARAPIANTSGQALEISPPVLNLSANPGTRLTATISIRNVSKGNLIVTGTANDFTAAGEDGTPKLLLDPTEKDPYSLRDWIPVVPRLLLVPREIKTMQIPIIVPPDASPGGHYGVVRFTATPPELEGTGVSLSASLGSLILVRVAGAVNENLSVASFTTEKGGKSHTLYESSPINFIERLHNTGNVHVQPAGQVQITDIFGRHLANMNVNLPPHNILPASIRKFDQTLGKDALGKKVLFGRYHAHLAMTYGDSKKTVSSDLVFWVIPYRLLIAILLFLIIGFYVLRFMIRRYNDRIVAQATGNRKSKKRGPRRR